METLKRNRIAITGLGIFSAAGRDVPSFTQSLLSGRSAIGPIDLFDVAPFPSGIGAQLRGFDPLDHFSAREARKLSRVDQFGLIAAGEALRDSGATSHYSPYDIGVSLGAGASGMLQSEEWLRVTLSGKRGDPSLLRGLLPDRTATSIAAAYNLCGYQASITTACSSSASSIGWGADLVATGRLKAALCGGSDCLSILTFAGFNSLKAVDPQPCSPFSLGRQGISLGEGAAFLVLEDEVEATRRGARIYGYILGYAVAGEAYHMTAPDPNADGAYRAMKMAVADAQLKPEDIVYINAHGTSTELNDKLETLAIKRLFADHAYKLAISSTKSMTGHMLGATGSAEAAFTALAIVNSFIPPTINYETPDEECDLNYTPNQGLSREIPFALSNSFGFGGTNASLLLKKFSE